MSFQNDSPQSQSPAAAFTFNIADSLCEACLQTPTVFTAALPDGNPLPEWLEFDEAKGLFAGTPTDGDVGMTPIKVTASDGAATVDEIFAIMVEIVDGHPTARALTNRTAKKANRFTLNVTDYLAPFDASDPMAYSANMMNGNELPDWLQFDERTGGFSGTPTRDDVGGLSVLVVASNGQETANSILSIEVEDTPDGPCARHIPETIIEEPKPLESKDEDATKDEDVASCESADKAISEQSPSDLAPEPQFDRSNCSIAYDSSAQSYTIAYQAGDTATSVNDPHLLRPRKLEDYLLNGKIGDRPSGHVDPVALRQIAASASQTYALMMNLATSNAAEPASARTQPRATHRGWFGRETRRDRRLKRQYRRGQ